MKRFRHFDSHVCTDDEITKEHAATGRLYLCPPVDDLYIFKNYE